MNNNDPIVVAPSALIGYNQLSESQERHIREALLRLAQTPTAQWSVEEVGYLKDNVYRLNGPDQLRVFFRRKDDKIILFDIAHQEMLDRYFSSAT